MIVSPNRIRLILARTVKNARGCWIWQGETIERGYGRVRVAGKKELVHRVVFEYFNGTIPDGLVIDHICRTQLCVNPAHLEPVTQSENVRRGYEARGLPSACRNGHPYTEETTYRHEGKRVCRICNNAASRLYRRKRRSEGN